MEFDLVKIGQHLGKNDLMGRPFQSFSKADINEFCNVVFEAAKAPEDAHGIPHINDSGFLVFPHPNVHPRFKYWAGGQPLKQTLKELGADHDTIERYCPSVDTSGLVPKTTETGKENKNG